MNERPRGYSDEEWTALQQGARIVRGRMHEDAAPVYEIRYPNGAVWNLDQTATLADLHYKPPIWGLKEWNELHRAKPQPAPWWKRALRRLRRTS